GETVEARDLWLTGARIDGHPDFFAHLARLAFTEQSPDEAWDKVLRGLRRISERGLHPGEWEEDEGRGGVLLRYLTEHLEESERPPPADAVELLGDLSGQIVEPEDRLDLGLCLAHVNRPEQAKGELRAALPHVEDHDRRDIGARKLCELMFPGFDERITRMAETEDTGEQPDALLAFLASVTEEVPQYWPAWFYRGRILERQGRWNEAYDAFRQAVTLRRDQAEIHARMAVSAYVLGRHVDALDAMQRAIEILPQDAGLHADHALLLFRAGKVEDAWKELEVAEVFDLDHEAVRMTRKILEAG
ncbi:MAG: tetratricopeptide repeat protein, partial [Planctomycetota bacterium]